MHVPHASLAPALLSLALAADPAPAPALEIDPLIDLAPREALFACALDLASLTKALESNAWARFARDEAMQTWLKHLAGGELPSLVHVEGAELAQAGIDPRDVERILSSGTTVVFGELAGADPNDMVIGAVIDVSGAREEAARTLGKLLDMLREEAELTGSEHAGIPITGMVAREHENGALFLAELGDRIALAGGSKGHLAQAALTRIVDRWGGANEGGGLLAGERHAASRKGLGFQPQVELFVDLSRFAGLVEASGGFDELELPAELRTEVLGLQWLHVAARAGAGEEIDLRIATGDSGRGLLAELGGLFGGPPRRLLELAPRNAQCLLSQSVDLAGLLQLAESVGKTLDRERTPDVAAALEGSGAGGLLERLTGELAAFGVEVPPRESLLGSVAGLVRGVRGDAPVAAHGMAVLIGMREARDAERALLELVAAPKRARDDSPAGTGALQIETLEGDGPAVHRVKLGAGALPFPLSLHSSATDDLLVLSLSPTAVREALRMMEGEAPSLLESKRFGAALERNAGASTLVMCDTAHLVRSSLSGLETGLGVGRFLMRLSGQDPDDVLPFGDGVPWPDPGLAERYFEGVVSLGVEWRGGVGVRVSGR